MSIRVACVVGSLITVIVLGGLFGTHTMVKYMSQLDDYQQESAYSIPVLCNLTSVNATHIGSCTIWQYSFDVGPLPGTTTPLGEKEAYGNFFMGRCFGRYLNDSMIGSDVSGCYASKDPTSNLVRISPLQEPEVALLIEAIVALLVCGLLICSWFVYNCVLWCGICGDVGPFSRESRRRRSDLSVRRSPAPPSHVPASRDPFDLRTIPVADTSWFSEVTFNNTFAQLVLQRFAPMPELQSGQDTEHSTELVSVRAVKDDTETPSSGDPPPPSECCICLERVSDAVVFPCIHFVCLDCLAHLAHSRVDELFVCPICRRVAFPVELRRVHAQEAPLSRWSHLSV